MDLDQTITAWMLWFWLGFSLAFILLVYLRQISVSPESKADGARSPRSISFAARIVLTLTLGVGILASAGIWPAFGRDAPWTSIAFWIGIACAVWIALLLYGKPSTWADDRQIKGPNSISK